MDFKGRQIMDIRFEDASEHAYELMNGLIKVHFEELVNCKILILMDLKQRMNGDKIVLGRMTKTNDLTRHLTIEESASDTGYDYIMYLDKVMWDSLGDSDRIRVIRHELRHTSLDLDAKNPYKLRPHTIEDFHSEIHLNEDDPRWRERVAILVESRYMNIGSVNPEDSQQKLPI
jgi:predicted metallopeptidase